MIVQANSPLASSIDGGGGLSDLQGRLYGWNPWHLWIPRVLRPQSPSALKVPPILGPK